MKSLSDKEKILNTVIRILDNEPLNIPDIERFVALLGIPINISSPSQDEVQAALYATRQVLRDVWFQESQNQQ